MQHIANAKTDLGIRKDKFTMKVRNICLTFLCVLLCLALLTACAAPRLSAEKIAATRATYPQFTLPSADQSSCYESSPLATTQSVQNYYRDAACTAVVTIESMESHKAEILKSENAPGLVVNRLYLNVSIDSIVDGYLSENMGNFVSLYIGTREALGEAVNFPAGTKLVVPITVPSDDIIFPEKDKFYMCAVELGYYVTNDHHILAVYDVPSLKEMEGQTLDAFSAEVKNAVQ